MAIGLSSLEVIVCREVLRQRWLWQQLSFIEGTLGTKLSVKFFTYMASLAPVELGIIELGIIAPVFEHT